MRKVFTTGQVSQICRVSHRTVCKWVDRGQLKGYKLPGGNDRRIPRESLVEFMQANSFPLEGLTTFDTSQVGVFDTAQPVVLTLTMSLDKYRDLAPRLDALVREYDIVSALAGAPEAKAA